MTFSVSSVRRQFPILKQKIDGHPLIYLDSAATSQKPQCVLDAMTHFYEHDNANINRGVHQLAERATGLYEDARKTVQSFINARYPYEIIFMRNATEAINLVARAWGRANMNEGDTVILSVLEHHSNIVPWLQLKEENGIEIAWVEPDSDGTVALGNVLALLDSTPVKLVSVTGLSNVLGTMPPLTEIISAAHDKGAKVCVDAAQLAVHGQIDVQVLGADFLAFSGHKLYGPTGIGVLFARHDLLENMPPFLGGGDMIQTVERSHFTAAELPRKFEAGTPAIADAIGLGTALEWLQSQDRSAIEAHERALIAHALEKLSAVRTVTILGPTDPETRAGCVSFAVEGIHPHDLTEILGSTGICLRAGHHCTQPLHRHLGITASVRLSVAAYNTMEEIDTCVSAVKDAVKFLKG